MSVVTFQSENKLGVCQGILQGDNNETTKGLIVLQEWWGLNDQIKDEAKQIGDLGNFVTLVPDLYRGKLAVDNEEAGHLMSNLDFPGAVADIQGAARYLLSTGCKKVGVTGFCMGGALSLASAISVKEISACAPFYGIPNAQFFDVSKIEIPVQAHFGEKDNIEGFSTLKEAEFLKKKQEKNKNFTLFIYKGCGHAFTHKGGPLGNYNEEACNLALDRTAEFMNEWLA